MRIALTTALAMLAFAGNSLLCRIALLETPIGPGPFTTLRVVSGALVLWAIVRLRDRGRGIGGAGSAGATGGIGGSWGSAAMLWGYAIAFALAYTALTAATGALLLFGAVQVTMLAAGLARGDRLGQWQLAGFAVAVAGLVALLMPGLSAPPALPAAAMAVAGVCWGVYSLRGRGAADPLAETAGNFVRASAFALAALAAEGLLPGRGAPWASIDAAGAAYAIASGALTSGVGYAIWYTALRGLTPTIAATVQLSVPAIAAAGGVLLLGEPLTQRLAWASVAVLGGIAAVVLARPRAEAP